MTHKSGFVNIIGKPNVGKSTLMNTLVGEQLSIVTSKVQTTRHRILGIINEEHYQLIFSDTPGIIEPKYALQESMMKSVRTALKDADIILLITDIYENPDETNDLIKNLNTANIPLLLVVNKTDKSKPETLLPLLQQWQNQLPKAILFPVSALKKRNTKELLNKIIELLPEHPPYFAKDALTDKPERFFMAEIIREKILLYYQKEIPYCVEVVVDSFKEEEKLVRIHTHIFVARDSQKGIILGKQGQAIKKTLTAARLDMEKFLKKKVFLEAHVKVNKDWRDNQRQLKKFGYTQ